MMGLEAKAVRGVIERALRAAVVAFDTTLSVRLAARETLGGAEAGFSPHPSLGDRPPA